MPAISVRVEAMRCHSSERVTQELLEAADDHQTSKLGTKHETDKSGESTRENSDLCSWTVQYIPRKIQQR